MKTPFFEQMTYGQIICKNIPDSRTVRRFIEKQIHRWILRHIKTDEPQNTQYFVTLQREREGHDVNCRVEIFDGKNIWLGMEYSAGLHQALIRCLNHLIPAPAPL